MVRVCVCVCLHTVSNDGKDCEVDLPLPVGALLQGDAIARGGKDVAAADGDQLAALVTASRIVQHRSVVDERIQFTMEREKRGGWREQGGEEGWRESREERRGGERAGRRGG